jgi:hypothetical protein
MEVVYQRCAGVDVHQRFLVVCLSSVEGGRRRKEIRSFSNETADLFALRTWLVVLPHSDIVGEFKNRARFEPEFAVLRA